MPEPATPRPRPRRRRWLWGLVGLVVVGLAGPTLVGMTPLPQSLLAGALPADAGRVTAGSTSLSWTGPIRLSGVELRSPADAVLVSVESVRLEGGLLGLLAGDSAPLRVRVDRPRVDLIVGPEGTNFDTLLAALAEKQAAEQPRAGPDGQPVTPGSRRAVEVVVTEGAVLVSDATTDDAWLLDRLGVRYTDAAAGFDAISLAADGKLSPYAGGQATGPGGDFVVKLGPSATGRHAEAQASGVPLVLLRPLLRRLDPTADVAGVLSLEGEADWRPSGQPIAGTGPGDLVRTLAAGGVRSTGTLRLGALDFVGQATQGGPVRLSTIDLPWRFTGADETLTLQQLDLTSEVGQAQATGAVSAGEVDRWAAGVAAAPRDLRVRARLDFDRLARVAPQFVRLQQGARIDAGRVELDAAFDAGRLDARLATGRLAGVAEGRRIEWREPLDITLAATQRAPAAGLAGWTLGSLNAKSSFFQATAEGDATRLSGEADFDLDRLAAELAPLIDLGDARLAGAGEARFLVNRVASAQAWRLQSRGGVRDLLIGDPAAPLAREPRLDFDARLDGSLSNLGAPPTGTVTLTAGDDRLTATLGKAESGAAQPFELTLLGDATRWWRRAATLSPGLPTPEAIALEGRVELNATGLADTAGGRLDRFKLALNAFGLDTAGLGADTPRVRLRNERIEAEGAADWSIRDRSARVPSGQFVSSFATAAVKDAILSLAVPAESRGRIDYRVDLAQLAGRLPPRDQPPRYRLRGQVGGMAVVRGVPEGVSLTIKADGRELALLDRLPNGANPSPAGRGETTVWAEPRAELDAELTVTPVEAAGSGPPAYALQVRDARVASQSVNGSFGGRVADLAALRGVDFSGGIDYDLEQLTPILWPTLGDGVRLVGRDRATFRVATDESAPPDAASIARLRATVTAPWEGADLFGLPVGPGRLAANLQRGVVRVDPLGVAIGGGRLTAEAAATLDPEPATLSLKPGALLTDVAMSQQVNERILKFIAPVLADATRIEGRFSVSLTELAVPLAPPPPSRPPPGRVAGVLEIHRVRVSPGPSVSEWVGVVQQLVALARDGVQSAARPSDSVLVAIDNTAVEFQLLDGRVYHRGLRFFVGDAAVESSGSVGVDETLDLLLSVPIQDEWVQREPVLLGRLRGQSLRIPVRGTFKKPKVDSRAFRELSGRVLESAAAGAVESGLNKLFEKLRSN